MSLTLWDVFAKAWHFTFPYLGLHRLLPITKTHTISFGFWLRITSDENNSHVVSSSVREASLHYSPLSREEGEIRLFVLHPGSDGDVVTGHMECHKLGSARKLFEALSYVWGRTDDSTTVLVDDTSVSVTKSLEAALCRLRLQDRPRTLWIDYVCINQCDIEERSDQVARMGLIYEFAENVLIWLGEATADTEVGIKILNYFAKEIRPQARPIWQDLPSSVAQAGLLDIMSRPWFQRLWVVQEIGRSGTAILICGQHEVKWKSNDYVAVRQFLRMIKYAEILPQWAQMGLGVVNMQPLLDMLDLQIGNQLDKSWGGSNRSASDLLDVVHSMRQKLCSDPRDKVFGILGLVDHMWFYDDFKPDYNMTVGQMYEALAGLSFT